MFLSANLLEGSEQLNFYFAEPFGRISQSRRKLPQIAVEIEEIIGVRMKSVEDGSLTHFYFQVLKRKFQIDYSILEFLKNVMADEATRESVV